MTNEVFFSWDSGITWEVVDLPETLIINELFSLDSKTEQFFVYGRKHNTERNRFFPFFPKLTLMFQN